MPRRPQRRLPLTARIKDGRIFQKSGVSPAGIIYLRCQQSTVCQGTAKIINGEIQIINGHSQYCVSDNLAENKAQFKQALKDSLRNHWYSLKILYDSFAAIYPEAAENISFESIRSYMKRCRRAVYPPAPDSIREFVERLLDPQFARNLEYETGRLTVALITDGGGDSHALFFDQNFVENEMRDVTKLFIDGTFRTTPAIEDAQQLVTVIGIRLNHTEVKMENSDAEDLPISIKSSYLGIPFMWIVMSRKTQAAYTAVLEYVREHVVPNNRIQLVMTDFERGLRNAISQVFSDAHITGCNTHHDRALYQKAKSVGLSTLLRQDDNAKEFFKKILALAYLPANLIRDQFARLENELDRNLKRRFSRFLQYYKRYWLQIVKPEGFSVYGLARRTNNISESYNSRLAHNLEVHPSPWDFVCKLLKLQSHAKADVRRLRNNCQIRRHARYASIYKQKQLVRAWRELHMLAITVPEFLEKAASLKGDVSFFLARAVDNEREGGDYELREAPITIPPANDPDFDRDVFADDPPHWLMDVAEVPRLAVANDAPENERGWSDSSSHESDDVENPNVIDEDFQPVAEVPDVHNQDEQARPHIIDEVLQPAEVSEIDDNDDGQARPHNIDEGVHPAVVLDLDGNLNGGQNNVNHDERGLPLPNNIARRTRKRPKKRRAGVPAAPSAPTSQMKQSRNKRRKHMREKKKLRLAEEREVALQIARAESARLQVELAAARAEAENQQRVVEENALCRVCLLQNATHTFLPCGHRCSCATCADRLWNQEEYRQCPLCRTVTGQAPVRIWLASE